MNSLESKCVVMSQTPQTKWFDYRFKPLLQLLFNMQEKGEIRMKEFSVPVFQMMNIHTIAFKFDGEYYVLLYSQVGKVYDFFHLERTNSTYSNILSSHIVLSSDNDPNEQTFLPMMALGMGIQSNTIFINKLNSIVG